MGRVTVSRISCSQLEAADNPFQSSFWAAVKQHSEWEPVAVRIRVVGPEPGLGAVQVHESTLLILLRRIALSLVVAYIPFGPRLAGVPMPVAAYLRELSKALQPLLPRLTICLRYDLPWREDDSEHFELFSGHGLHVCKESVQPEGTAWIMLGDGYGTVKSAYRERAVRNIRKTQALGVSVREWGGNEEEFKAWYAVYQETAKRDGFAARPAEYLRRFLDYRTHQVPDPSIRFGQRREGARFSNMVVAEQVSPGNEVVCRLYLAYLGNRLLGGTIVMESKNVAVYLFGSSLRVEGISCSYLLQDHTIKSSWEHGCSLYDLYGISGPGERGAHLEGLRLFKRSFGGVVRYRHPSIDYPYRYMMWFFYAKIELMRFKAKRMRQPKRISQQYSVSHEA
jgi:lipid II:glycine glycyltransferase (peptidoglycan interpeptide bridge formation enzyme)